MNNPDYFSFLICHHKDVINLYYNGIPIGFIKDGVFNVYQFDRNDQKVDLRIEDLPHPRPFKTIEELKEKISSIVNLLDIKHEEKEGKEADIR